MEMKKSAWKQKDENLYPVLEFAKEFLEEQGCSVKIQMLFEVCMEEWFINVAHYAYPDQTDQVEVQIKLDEETVELVFTDKAGSL